MKMTKFHGVGRVKKEDRLRKSAEMRLKLGQIQQYCELMVQVGDVSHFLEQLLDSDW